MTCFWLVRALVLIDYMAKICRLIDFGHSQNVAANQAGSFYTKDLLCGSNEAVLGRPVTLLGDWQGLLYALVALAWEAEFEWAKAAEAGVLSAILPLIKPSVPPRNTELCIRIVSLSLVCCLGCEALLRLKIELSAFTSEVLQSL